MIPAVPAYLDPTAGSIAYQAAISGLLAAAAACRMYWSRIRRLFGGGHRDRAAAHHSRR
jgi:hypothetical protein